MRMPVRLCRLSMFVLAIFTGNALAQNPTWTDPAAGLMWTKKDNGRDVTWQQAANYCQNLSLGGYSGWRSPTIDELAGIYDKTQNVDDMHIKGGIKISGYFVWSSLVDQAAGKAWHFNFHTGERDYALLDGGYVPSSIMSRALCVRRSGE